MKSPNLPNHLPHPKLIPQQSQAHLTPTLSQIRAHQNNQQHTRNLTRPSPVCIIQNSVISRVQHYIVVNILRTSRTSIFQYLVSAMASSATRNVRQYRLKDQEENLQCSRYVKNITVGRERPRSLSVLWVISTCAISYNFNLLIQ